MKMNKLEKYLIKNHNTLKACDKNYHRLYKK